MNTLYESRINTLTQHLHTYGIKVCQEPLVIEENNISRFQTPLDKKGARSGFAILFNNTSGELEAAQYGDWHDPDKKSLWVWNKEGRSPKQLEELHKYIEEVRQNRQKDIDLVHQESAKRLEAQWSAAVSATDKHPYLQRKNVQAYGLRLDPHKGDLVIPLCNGVGKLMTVQTIDADGTKKLAKGGKAQGSHFMIQGSNDYILIAEGYATTATLFATTGYTSVMAVNCGNMSVVARTLSALYPHSTLVLCADNDCHKDPNRNPGVEAARSAAKQVNGLVCIPRFKDLEGQPTDFNDLATREGSDEVQQQVNAVLALGGIPSGYMLQDGTIFQVKLVRDGEGKTREQHTALCSYLRVVALTRSHRGNSWGRLLELIDQDGNKHLFTMTMETLAMDNAAWLGDLLNKGLVPLSDSRFIKSYLLQCNPRKRLLCANKVGWYDNTYVTKQGAIGSDAQNIIYQDANSNELENGGFPAQGALSDWQTKLASLCINNSRLLFATSAAFGAIVLPFLFGESGGFHFRCGSSRGKTTILQLAQSVMSSGSTLARWRATANGLEGIASAHNHSLLVLDELSQLAETNPKVAGEAIYMLGNGEGKQRAKQNGSLAKRVSWQLLFLSAGEVSLAGILEQAGITERGGQSVRFIDIPADAGKGFGVFDEIRGYEDGNQMAQAIKRYAGELFGSAALGFINQFSMDVSNNTQRLNVLVAEFIDSLQLASTVDPQIKRVAQRFAIVAAAGELANELNITGWPVGQARWGAKVCFDAWLAQRGSTESQESDVILATLRDRLVQWKAKIIDLHGLDGASPFEVWGYTDNSGDYFMLPKPFREHICKGLEIREVEKVLSDYELLVKNGTSASKVKKIQGNALRVYHIKRAVLDDQTDEQPATNTAVA